jgi:4-hydroxyphenylacetate 3-monooxygenase
MGARSGNNYLSAMRKLKSEIWIGGERVADPTTHPALKPVMRSLASLYDMQIEHPEAMTYRAEFGSSDSGASLGDILGAAIRRQRGEADSEADAEEKS